LALKIAPLSFSEEEIDQSEKIHRENLIPRGLPASRKDEASIVAKSAAAGEKREALWGLLAPSEPEKLVRSN